MIQIRVNDNLYEVPEDLTIKEACKRIGVYVPSLCYHEDVPSGGICGLCVVKVDGVAHAYSCMTHVRPGLIVNTVDKDIIEKQISHFHKFVDMSYPPYSEDIEEVMKYLFPKKTVRIRQSEKINAISFQQQKCIDCKICVRMCADVVDIGALDDPTVPLKNGKCISCGLCTLTCPTQALTETNSIPYVLSNLVSKDASFLIIDPSVLVSVNDGFEKNSFGVECTEKVVSAAKLLGFKFVLDNRLANDFLSLEMTEELLNRIERKGHEAILPMINSNCPAIVNYVEKSAKEFIPNLSTVKPPQHVLARAIRKFYAATKKAKANDVFIVHLTSCVTSKDHVKRMQFSKDIDASLTTREFIQMINMFGIDWNGIMQRSSFDDLYSVCSRTASLSAVTGGLTTSILRILSNESNTPNKSNNSDKSNSLNEDDFLFNFDADVGNVAFKSVKHKNKLINVAVCNGVAAFSQLLASPDKFKELHFIEVMACSGGCVAGGGQVKASSRKLIKPRIDSIYRLDRNGKSPFRNSDDPKLKDHIKQYIIAPLVKQNEVLFTHYEPQESALLNNKKKALSDLPIVAYGSTSGKATRYARLVAGFIKTSSSSMNSINLEMIKRRKCVIFVISTIGDGQFPANSAKFMANIIKATDDLSNVSFAILGLGDARRGEKFALASVRLNDQMLKLGAKQLIPLAKLDSFSKDGGDDVYAKWSAELSESLLIGKPKIGMEFLNRLEKIEDQTIVDKPSRPIGFEVAEIVDKTLISPPDFRPKLTKVLIKLPEGLSYELGDHVKVLPCNDKELTEKVIKSLQFSRNDVFNIKSGDSIIPTKVTVFQLFSQYLDLNCMPTSPMLQSFFNAANEEGKKKIEPLLKEGSEERNKFEEEFNTGEAIIDFASFSKPSLDILVSSIPHITPRLYSAASSPDSNVGHVELYVNEVTFESGKIQRNGLCTNFLSSSDLSKIAIFFTRGKFHYPKDIDTPVIFIALGSGISPMMPLIQHRARLRATDGVNASTMGPAFLIFGSKYRGAYSRLLGKIKSYKENGDINETFYAFSRDPPDATDADGNKLPQYDKYIQDVMKKNGTKLWDLWQNPKTCVFFCGPSRGIPDQLKDILLEITIHEGWLSREEAMAYNSRHDWHIEGI